MNILFLGALYSQDKIDEYKNNSKSGLQFAAQNLQESLIEGAIENGAHIEVVAKPVLSTFPHGYRKLRVSDCDYIFKNKKIGKSLGYINIPFLNKPTFSQYNVLLEDWYKKNEGEKSIWVYSLTKQMMQVAVNFKNNHQDVKLVLIVPDLLRFCGCNKYYRMMGFQKKNIKLVQKLCQSFDRYVLLCENMAKDLGIEEKVYTIMEGIFTSDEDDCVLCKNVNKTILYTGNLDKRYGIIDLLDAFQLIKDDDYRLWIRGNGNTEIEIKERMKQDKRISLIPQLSKNALLRLEREASLLVNPVSYREEFSKFFFPSKTMDYLASGTPTMMHKLACLPNEYLEYLYLFKNDTPTQMATDIQQFFTSDLTTRTEKGRKASKFIRTEKTAKNQVKKIFDIL